MLQFIGHEEGRIRYNQAGSAPVIFNYDYFLKDHLGNVREVITEEIKVDKYPVASLEDEKLSTEALYYNIDATKVVTASSLQSNAPPAYINDNGIGNTPEDASFSNANSQKLYKLNSNTNKTGLGITLKVMAGDKIDVLGSSYYYTYNTGGNSSNNPVTILDLLNGFLNSPGAEASTGLHRVVTPATINTPVNTGIISAMFEDQTSETEPNSLKPRAYINYLFFDEQFKCVKSGFSKVGNPSEVKPHFQELQNLTVTKNGFIYIYCSNESPVDVFFDNLQVVHTRGPILEETSYYPFGLVMQGISSKAAGGLENKKKFNGIEYENSFDLNIGEAFFRTHDPQTGRWWQIDPKSDKYFNYSPYCAMGNNPILIPDILGDEIDIPYQETITKKNGKTKTVERNFVWEPGKKYTGKNEGVIATVASLEKLYTQKDELNLQYIDDNGKQVNGNVLTDFLKGGKFEDVKVTIFPGMDHTQSLNKKSLGVGIDIIHFNQNEGLKILPYKEQGEGIQAPFFGLLHEFGHVWLNNVARNRMEAAVRWPDNKKGNSVEEQLILDKVQNARIAQAYGQPQQIYYRQSAYYPTQGPLTTQPPNQ